MIGATMRGGSELDATFESGARVTFCHLQHENTKYEYQGSQFAYLAFDELTHFTKTQWLYLLGRARTTCGVNPYVRCTCNPDAGSWVADLISWWIDQETGIAIPDRSGVVRYLIHEDDVFIWADTKQELIDQYPEHKTETIMSFTFISASVHDNPQLLKKDPTYISRLMLLPKIERERLLGCNWKVRSGAIIDTAMFKTFTVDPSGRVVLNYHGQHLEIDPSKLRRFATIDTAGTSKEKAAELRGDPPSYSCCAIFDHYKHRDRISNFDVLMLRYMWRKRVGWSDLKSRIPEVLSQWHVPKVVIENAHFGQALAAELNGFQKQLVNTVIPGMKDSSNGAKLERAIASGMLSRLEDIGIWLPDDAHWVSDYLRELNSWTGLPKETADQIDVTSYGCFIATTSSGSWGGVV